MTAEKAPPALLHELLKEEQEPFHLKTYIANKQSQIKALQLRKPRPGPATNSLRKHACFLSLTASPLKSPCKSPVFLHFPSLTHAALRIQKQPPRSRFSFLSSFLKRLKNRSRAITKSTPPNHTEEEEHKSLNFEASTSSRVSDEICGEFCLNDDDSCFCTSPFRFSLHHSPSSTGRLTPEFSSPPASPRRRAKQQAKENSDNVQGDEGEEKEQCSPVSVLDPPFDEDDVCESGRADEEEEEDEYEDEEEYDMDCSYENVQRAKQKLMHRLRRFELLAELDPVELEKKLQVEGSDDEGHVERDGDESFSPYRQQHGAEPLSADMKRLVSDLIVEEKRHMDQSGGSEVMMGRICNRLDSWKAVEFDTVDMMIGLDFKKEVDGWSKHGEQVQETTAEIEVAIYLLLIQELTEELLIS
ncbi:hypothetical protein SASPL_105562 [Salvia splendens]|uniref:DUF4378 domain-containing protein n=1 Tax=Salvia splendens TaxID=180675 RepID=A0A8X8YJF3_SALSN|nr:uncharacterized protein LOC121764489 [Salvia splendens]KAG6433943.1 hypothetical protein SASPL_105562 [Salvia splendens]